MNDLFTRALHVARSYDVSTPENGAVLYSVSYQPTKQNRDQAFAFAMAHPDKMVIEHTDCGAKLVEMGLSSNDSGLTADEIAEIWSIASKRFIKAAAGELTAFVDNADPRSVFRRMELPNILENSRLTTINGIDKREFAEKFK